MIVVRIHAGLGNQMFQYAMARALALQLGCELQLDVSDCGKRTPYGLGVFNVVGNFASEETAARLRQKKTQWVRLVYLLSRYDIRRASKHYFLEGAGCHDPTPMLLDPVHRDYYIEGYWQSQDWFVDAAETIRRELTFREPLDERNAAAVREIESVEAVSIHLRRGDYVSSRKLRRIFAVPMVDYCRRAMEFIAERVDNPHFFVFSNDHPWVRENIAFRHPATFIDHNRTAASAYKDLALMARCRHNIIANSTFSWWGAWLNSHPEKIVTAPEPWFLKAEKIPPNVVPVTWHRIPAF